MILLNASFAPQLNSCAADGRIARIAQSWLSATSMQSAAELFSTRARTHEEGRARRIGVDITSTWLDSVDSQADLVATGRTILGTTLPCFIRDNGTADNGLIGRSAFIAPKMPATLAGIGLELSGSGLRSTVSAEMPRMSGMPVTALTGKTTQNDYRADNDNVSQNENSGKPAQVWSYVRRKRLRT